VWLDVQGNFFLRQGFAGIKRSYAQKTNISPPKFATWKMIHSLFENGLFFSGDEFVHFFGGIN